MTPTTPATNPTGPAEVEHGAMPSDQGDPRGYLEVGAVELEAGGLLPAVTVAYETWGRLNEAGDNAVMVEHALTGDSHVVGDAGPFSPTPGWWPGLIGPGAPLDTERYFVVASNVLGGCRGTTGPGSVAPDGRAWGSRFPTVTTRDQVEVERRLADHLGISSFAAVIGGSMGGMRALEWAVTHPERVRRAVVLASTPAATGDQIAWCYPQLLAITSDPDWLGGDYYGGPGPVAGLEIARRIAHTTYRSGRELDVRFGRAAQTDRDPVTEGGQFAVESYLDHQAGKLSGRFDAGSYVHLTRSMNSHDVGRGRGGTQAALRRITGQLVLVAVDSDRLYPPRLSQEMADAVPGSSLTVIGSEHGHDGFLIETPSVGRILRAHLR